MGQAGTKLTHVIGPTNIVAGHASLVPWVAAGPYASRAHGGLACQEAIAA